MFINVINTLLGINVIMYYYPILVTFICSFKCWFSRPITFGNHKILVVEI